MSGNRLDRVYVRLGERVFITADEHFPAVPGDRLTVNVGWDDRKERFVRKK